ncbi:MAG: leucine--tRNA ligase, partial [Candidatus Nanoarchaeia archaeon]|nr:leucine--tRNA ligase [Candidatus Nanoarchaeia archaeon]
MEMNIIEKKWQDKWEKYKVFKADVDSNKKKFYCLEMFPYPSGKLHMGHLRNYSIVDSIARFKRMKGLNVMYPVGFDAFGLPAENAAIKNNIHPREWTFKSIKEMSEQLKSIGFSYDWDRLTITCIPEYYKWNQWIFLKMYENGLIYRKKASVNWCPGCSTVLANEQVENGKCWRCKSEVAQEMLEQWFIKITAYADELLNDLDKLKGKWPEKVLMMQKNWIGKSQGTTINFKVDKSNEIVSVFTTRPDTIFGVTYLVMAPEHELITKWVKGTEYEKKVNDFALETKKKSTLERESLLKDKNGIFIGKYVINPVNGEKCPIYIADYVVMSYGTGAVMAVPTHDQRDFEFAKKYDLPLKIVIMPKNKKLDIKSMKEAYTEQGTLVNSEDFNEIDNEEAKDKISAWLKKKGWGEVTVQYKLRDWLISRQRYWGTPIPMIWCEKCGMVPVPEKDLPVILPDDIKFGEGNPLTTSESFKNVKCPKCKEKARREVETLDTFFDSSWYYLRYCDSKNNNEIFNKKSVKYWMPIDQYVGGIEHAILHLLYARFFTKFLRDLELLNFDEPFQRLLSQGMVLKDGTKMSKSIGNIVEPKEITSKYGADTARLFILSAALPEKEMEWNDKGVNSNYKIIQKILATSIKVKNTDAFKIKTKRDEFLISKLNFAIKECEINLENYEFNFAITRIVSLLNYMSKFEDEITKEVFDYSFKRCIIMLAPFIPHSCEEIWERLGNKSFISLEKWPIFDESKIDLKIENMEKMTDNLIKDIHDIIELTKKIPKKIKIFVSNEWKYSLCNL